MPNRAWAVARKLERNRLVLLGKPLNTRPDSDMIEFVAGRLAENHHHAVVAEIRHQMQRRSNAAGHSDVEAIGDAWRKAHGFGRPFLRLGGRGSGSAYRERQRAEEAARKRKMQKASRVRDRLANGARKTVGALKQMLFRGAGRGA